MPAVLTPPTAPPICLTIPRNVMQNQYNFCSYLSQCHELWEQADLYVVKRGVCESKIYYLGSYLTCNCCTTATDTHFDEMEN